MGRSTYLYISFLIVIIFNHVISISDLRACADENCSEILSTAKTLLTYHSDNNYTLSFAKDLDVKVYSKSAGSDRSLWGVSINGSRGYAPKKFLKEMRKLNKIRFIVATEYFEQIHGRMFTAEDQAMTKLIDEENVTQKTGKGAKENVELNENAESFTSQETIEKPDVISQESGENFNDQKIDATPSYVVIEGTTIHPVMDEEVQIVDDVIKNGDIQNLEVLDSSIEENTDSETDRPSEETESIIKEIKTDAHQPLQEVQHSSEDEKKSIPLVPSVNPDSNSNINYNSLKENSASMYDNTESSELKESVTDYESSSLPDSIEEDLNEKFNTSIENTFESNENISESHEAFSDDIKNVPINNINNNLNVSTEDESITNSNEGIDNLESLSKNDSATPLDLDTVVKQVEKEEQSEENNSSTERKFIKPPYNLYESISEHPPNQDTNGIAESNKIDNQDTSGIAESNKMDNQDTSGIAESNKMDNVVPDSSESSSYLHNKEIKDPKNNDIIEEKIEYPNQKEKIEPTIELPQKKSDEFVDSLPKSNMGDNPNSSENHGVGVEVPLNPIEKLFSSSILSSHDQNVVTVTESPNIEHDLPSTIPSVATTDHPNVLASDPTIDLDTQLHPESLSSVSDEIVKENSIKSEHSKSDGANEDSFFSNMLHLLGSSYNFVFDVFKSKDSNQDGVVEQKLEEKSADNIDKKISGWNSFIASFSPEYQALPQCRPEDNVIAMTEVSSDLILWLVISAVSVLSFTLGYYFLENRKQDGKLLAMVNSLQKELLCSSKECILLKDELTITKEKLIGIEDSSFGSDEMVASLKKEIAESKQTISELHDKLAQTEDELANSTEAALELQAILDEQLSSKDTSNSSLTFTVTNLQAQLDDQQATMNLTKEQLAAKIEENELLLSKLVEIGNKTSSVDKELVETQNQLLEARKECESKAQQLQELTNTMEKSLQQLQNQRAAEIKNVQSQLKNTRNELESSKILLKARAHEVTSLQESFKALKLDGAKIEALLDVSSTKAELVQVSTEKNALTEKLEKQDSLLNDLTNKVESQENQMKAMRDGLNEAEQNAIQATSRLEVLTNYFNQKEAELIKELNTKEGLWLSQQGENMSTVEKIQSLQQEIQQYKETTESVRRELAEQEAAWRARNAALERRAHEQWLARRAAERQGEAAASEAQTLRQRLAAPSPTDKPQGMISPLNSIEGIGDLPLLPPPPLPFPPFPLAGLPPPPFLPPPLPTHRPPPLGRLSSPPPLHPPLMRHERYSPDSRYSPNRERDYSPDRRSTPQHRGRSPYMQEGDRRRQYNSNRRYEDDRYYDSGEDRRSHRRYDETETDMSPPPSPPPPLRRGGHRNHKGVSSGSGQSSESLERISKHSNKY